MKIRSLFLFSFFMLIAFPACYFNIGINIRFSVLIALLVLFFISLFNFNFLLKGIKQVLNKKVGKAFMLFMTYIIITSIILCINGTLNISEFFRSIFLRIIPLMFLPMLFAYFVNKYYSSKELIKFYYIFLLLIFSIGLIDFIIFLFRIDILEKIYQMTIINNRFLSPLSITEKHMLVPYQEFSRFLTNHLI